MKKLILIAATFGFAAALTASAADGKANWDSLCAKCHGADGKGQTKMGQKLGVKDLTDAEVSRIQDVINADYTVEGELQRIVTGNIKRLKDINAYRGLRHKANLPSRGQRTRTNARTRRGKKMTVGGTAKKAPSKT